MNWEVTPISTATAAGLFLVTTFIADGSTTAYLSVPALLLSPKGGSSHTTTNTSNQKITYGPGPSPAHLLRQWKSIFDKGKIFAPLQAILASVSWFYVARKLPAEKGRARALYIAGALFCLTPMFYTGIFMRNDLKELNKRAVIAESGRELEEEVSPTQCSTPELIKCWLKNHTVRTYLPLGGLICVVAANVYG